MSVVTVHTTLRASPRSEWPVEKRVGKVGVLS
jgi:hypothetical protein